MNSTTRALVEGAITVAISVVLLLLMVYTPLGYFTFFVVPIPYMVYRARHTWQSMVTVGIVSLIVASLFMSILVSPLVFYAWTVGLVLGYSLSKKHSGLITFILTATTIFGLFLFALFVSSAIFGINLIDEFVSLVDEIFQESSKILENALGGAYQPLNYGEYVRLYFPSLLIINALFLGFVNYWIGYALYKRLGHHPRPFPALSELRFPRSVLYYYVILLVLTFIPAISTIDWLRVTLLNVFPIFDMILVIQGILFAFFIAKARNMGKALPVISIVLLFIPPFAYILKIIGVVDIALPLREKFTSRS